MSTSNIEKLDKRYIEALLLALEKNKSNIDLELYENLKQTYTAAYNIAKDKSAIRDGFITLEAIMPDPEVIKNSVKSFLEKMLDMDKEKKKVEERYDKLDELLSQGNISENVYNSKKREYDILIDKINDQMGEYIQRIPDTLKILEQLNEQLKEKLEEIEVDSKVKKTDDVYSEKKRLQKHSTEIRFAIKELSSLGSTSFISSSESINAEKELKQDFKAEFQPLKIDAIKETKREIESEQGTLIKPPRGQPIWAKWKNITIGKLIGGLNFIGNNQIIIATDRPSLAIIRELALVGPSSLKSITNPKSVEDRLRKLVKDAYSLNEQESLLPDHLVKYVIENKIAVDLFKLINSYYASVDKKNIYITKNEAIIDENVQILSLAENLGLIGRRVLAPDRSLIGVVHELYYEPSTSELYLFTFKGVPPQVIRKLYHDIYRKEMTDGTFNTFRTEISSKLSIPIYEALTPSSVLRYSIVGGTISNLNQLVTLVESMNPRISKSVDISAISAEGIILSRYPQNALPKIEYFEY